MTDRFSPEYIAFILSDEASVLQRYWDENEGDAFVATATYEEVEGDDWPCVDIDIGEINYIHSAWRIDDNGKAPSQVGKWLPSLWDLVSIGAMARKSIELHRIFDADGDNPTWRCAVLGLETYELDVKVAAAKLAVRVLEGKE